jgi:4'-phosphopantetheinyl transferase
MELAETPWSEAPAEFELAENEAVIWRASLECEAAALRRLEATLSPDEKLRADRFIFSRDRDHFVAGRGILRALLGAYAGRHPSDLVFRYGPQGKPELHLDSGNSSLSFNLSHKEGLAVYVVGRGRSFGIDVESIAEQFPGEEIARRFFSKGELEELLALPPEARCEGFFLAWTRKEAYIKAEGQGLLIPLDSFDVSLTPGQPAKFLAGVPPEWQILSFRADHNHPAALVYGGNPLDAVRFFSWRLPLQSET